jgi:hypothetical protein
MRKIETIDDLIGELSYYRDRCIQLEHKLGIDYVGAKLAYEKCIELVEELKADMDKKEEENIKHLCLTCNQIRKSLEKQRNKKRCQSSSRPKVGGGNGICDILCGDDFKCFKCNELFEKATSYAFKIYINDRYCSTCWIDERKN